MSVALVYTRACIGLKAPLVTVEAHLSSGLPGLSIVGLPEAAVRESKDRVRSALMNSQFEFPSQRITINLAPADLPKEGSRFDLPIALGILAASDQIPKEVFEEYEFAGELALSGSLRRISSVLPLALGTRQANRALIVPIEDAEQAAFPGDNVVYGAKDLLEVFSHLLKTKLLTQTVPTSPFSANSANPIYDLSDIKGQGHAKRALEIAAAGGHSLLMMGPPGTGKTMMAMRLPSIMPPLTLQQSLEVMAIHSLRSKSSEVIPFGARPFRSPHHTASAIALVGGGSKPMPGEISLAHHGILFLDELPEFNRHALEVLREPLESGQITISRARHQAEFPAKFQLVTAMNPCPCGNLGDITKNCQCTSEQVQRYRSKISGPLWDRIDMQIEVPRLDPRLLRGEERYRSDCEEGKGRDRGCKEGRERGNGEKERYSSKGVGIRSEDVVSWDVGVGDRSANKVKSVESAEDEVCKKGKNSVEKIYKSVTSSEGEFSKSVTSSEENVNKTEKSSEVRERVMKAVKIQIDRGGVQNAHLSNTAIEHYMNISDTLRQFMVDAVEKLGLSARSYYRALRLARTIADLEGTDDIGIRHLAEALSYRRMDKG